MSDHGHADEHRDEQDGHDDQGEHDDDHGNHRETHDEHHGHNDEHHDHHAHDLETVKYGIVTISSTRTFDNDPAGDTIESAIEDAGGEVALRDLIRDSFDGVQGVINTLVDRDDVNCIVTTGGTGVTPDDVTVEAVEPLFEKALPGFGELFRALSREEIGKRVVATRATAGIVDGVLVFCLPGSENAARLGAREIITEQAPHLAGLAARDEDEE